MPESMFRCTKARIAIVATLLVLVLLSTYILLHHYVFAEPTTRLEFEPASENSLIWINTAAEREESKWASTVEQFIDKYKIIQADGLTCSYENGQRASTDNFCRVDITKLSKRGCVWGSEEKFGYMGQIPKPCVILKLDNEPDWVPEPYMVEDLEEINMPRLIADEIRRLSSSSYLIERNKLDTIWISCEGLNATDKENVRGIKFYTPGYSSNLPGIPGYYFPYAEQSGYQVPFVFVQFEDLSPYILSTIECKAWAKNIDPDSKLPYQSVQFGILID